MEVYSHLSKKNNESKTGRIIVWPETVLNSSAKMNEDAMKQVIGSIGPDSLLVAGGTRYGRNKEIFNSVFFISGNGYVRWYDKNILLPFSETKPMNIGTLGRYYSAPDEFSPGTMQPFIKTEMSGIGVSICFEVIYPWHIRKSILSGADLLVNVSNDGWFGDTAEPYQHMDIARFRAIENRRFLLRASNNGISAAIDPLGNIREHTRLFKKEILDSRIIRIKTRSIYSIAGDIVLYMAIIIIFIQLIIPIVKKSEKI
jgi:apolipoprotein N-acyltransferase